MGSRACYTFGKNNVVSVQSARRKSPNTPDGTVTTLFGAYTGVTMAWQTACSFIPTAICKCIARKISPWGNRASQWPLERLEPDDAKVSCPVLRGLRHDVAYIFVMLSNGA